MINPELFSTFRKSLDRGEFKYLNPNSPESISMWQEQYRRCIEGYSVGGYKISGRLYAYINFGTIELVNEKTNHSLIGPPTLRDVELLVFGNIERAIEQGKNLMWISGRRGGKSFILSFLAAYEFTFFKTGKAMIGASDTGKANDCMYKCHKHLSELYGKTQFYRSLSKTNHEDILVSGWQEKTEQGFRTVGDTAFIYNVCFVKHTAAVGKRVNYAGFEEVGMFNNLIKCYNSTKPCWKQGTKNIGYAVLAGTGGDMEKGTIDASKMFEDPDTYELLAFWDDQKRESSKSLYIPELPYKLNRTQESPCAFFLPGTMVLDEFKSNHCTTDVPAAQQALEDIRNVMRRGKNPEALLQQIQYFPITVQEAFLSSSYNSFPVALLQDQVERITLDSRLRNLGIRGDLEFKEGELVFTPNSDLREADYPVVKGRKNEGCIVIYEMPHKTGNVIPHRLYIAGADPYTQDEAASSDSLGSTFIYKRMYKADKTYDVIVAEYTGRPLTADDFHEKCRKLYMFYNATCLYENNVPGMKQYFQIKNSLHLLAVQPNIVNDIILNPVSSRTYGICNSAKMKAFIIESIRTWLLTEYEPGRYNLEKIYSLNLLKELINYTPTGNFDRVIAFGLCLIQDQEWHRVSVEKANSASKVNFGQEIFQYYDW